MKHLLAVVFLLLVVGFTQIKAQTPIPRISKQAIGESGCYGYFPADMPAFERSKSDDGSDVYTSHIDHESGFTLGCIVVRFSEAMPNEDWDGLVESYLVFLQEQLGITATAGLGAGHKLESNPNAQGYIDYWQDADGSDYAIKAWIDDAYLAVMLIIGPADELNYNFQSMYQNGFRFPDAKE